MSTPVSWQQLFRSVDQVARAFLYSGAADAEAVAALFPADFHANLRQLVTKILLAHADAWRESAIANQVAAPRLVDFGAPTFAAAAAIFSADCVPLSSV